jgi:hypothetical protein
MDAMGWMACLAIVGHGVRFSTIQAKTPILLRLLGGSDKLPVEAARTLAPWLSINQCSKMDRREILTILAVSMDIPLAGVDLLWNGVLTEVSNTSLNSLQDVTTVLASKYSTSPPHTLLGSVMGHLDKTATLLRTTAMKPIQRQRLESIIADAAIFVGFLSMQTGKMAQADANFELAKKMARQASNMALLSQVLAGQALLNYYGQSPKKANDDPRPRIDLLEEAQALAKRHAPPMMQMAIHGWLAEDKAVAKDGYDADEALEQSHTALEQAKLEGSSGTGFCAGIGYYSGYDQGELAGLSRGRRADAEAARSCQYL